jgi:anaerobic magnesium-protoporphyrin IX monomethyl ester cyclase
VFFWFKLIEAVLQLRPTALARLLHRDSDYRHAMRWYTRIGRQVWLHEVREFLFKRRRLKNGPTLREFMGGSLAEREYVLAKNPAPRRRSSNSPDAP